MTQFDQRYQQVDQQYDAGRDINIYPNGVPYGMTPVQQRQNRERMIERVRIFWIKGVLEQSLQHVVSLSL